MKLLPNIEYLNECFDLRENGELFWKTRPHEHFNGWYGTPGWNKKYAGKRADVDMRNGYYAVCINAVRYKSHRVVFAMANGFDPKDSLIDHKDYNGKNNQPDNLRLSDYSQNAVHFDGARSDNSASGFRGVAWNIHNKKWEASVFHKGKRKYLGLFADKNLARLAAEDARKQAFGEYYDVPN